MTGLALDQNNQAFSPPQTLRGHKVTGSKSANTVEMCFGKECCVQSISQHDVSLSSQQDLTTYVICAHVGKHRRMDSSVVFIRGSYLSV